MEKYITLRAPIKKVNEDGVLITYKLKFIDSNRLMPASLSDLTDNLSEINQQECKKYKDRENTSINCKYICQTGNRSSTTVKIIDLTNQ